MQNRSEGLPITHIRQRQEQTADIRGILGLQRRGILERFQPERMLNEGIARKSEEAFQFVGQLFASTDKKTLSDMCQLIYKSIDQTYGFMWDTTTSPHILHQPARELLTLISSHIDTRVQETEITEDAVFKEDVTKIRQIQENIATLLNDTARVPHPFVGRLSNIPFFQYSYVKDGKRQIGNYAEELETIFLTIEDLIEYGQEADIPFHDEQIIQAAKKGWEKGNREENKKELFPDPTY